MDCRHGETCTQHALPFHQGSSHANTAFHTVRQISDANWSETLQYGGFLAFHGCKLLLLCTAPLHFMEQRMPLTRLHNNALVHEQVPRHL
jgi:hypothetical protein